MDTITPIAPAVVSATSTMTAVQLTNQQGLQLYGILHEPRTRKAGAEAILLLSPGVKMRVAPHRLYMKMAERFVALGYPVLRFDFHGLGDSEGEATETLLADLYRATQVGRYVADTIAAMDWMQRTCGTTRFIAAGLCGGALTGLLAAERDSRITGLLALSIPVILDGSDLDAAQYMTVAQMHETRAAYLRKLRPDAWRSWIRLLTFQSDYRMLGRLLTKPLRRRLWPATPAAAAPDMPTPDNTNPYFAPAFRRMVSTSRRVLLIFAESDRLFWEFESKFMGRHAASLEQYRNYFRVHVTPQANHIFSFAEWQHDVLDQCSRWLDPAVSLDPAGISDPGAP